MTNQNVPELLGRLLDRPVDNEGPRLTPLGPVSPFPIGVRVVDHVTVVSPHHVPQSRERGSRRPQGNEPFRHPRPHEQALFHRLIPNPPECLFVLARGFERSEDDGEMRVIVRSAAKPGGFEDPPVVVILGVGRMVLAVDFLRPHLADSLGDHPRLFAHERTVGADQPVPGDNRDVPVHVDPLPAPPRQYRRPWVIPTVSEAEAEPGRHPEPSEATMKSTAQPPRTLGSQMFVDATDARRTTRLLAAAVGFLIASNLSYALLPNPASRYVSLTLLLLAGWLWAYMGFQRRIARGDRWAVKGLDPGLFRRRAVSEAAGLTGGDEHHLATRRGWLLALLAASSLLAVARLLWRMTS